MLWSACGERLIQLKTVTWDNVEQVKHYEFFPDVHLVQMYSVICNFFFRHEREKKLRKIGSWLWYKKNQRSYFQSTASGSNFYVFTYISGAVWWKTVTANTFHTSHFFIEKLKVQNENNKYIDIAYHASEAIMFAFVQIHLFNCAVVFFCFFSHLASDLFPAHCTVCLSTMTKTNVDKYYNILYNIKETSSNLDLPVQSKSSLMLFYFSSFYFHLTVICFCVISA